MLSFFVLSALAGPALALPAKFSACSTSNAKLDLPSGQTALVEPAYAPSFVTLGIGIQNYTCSSAGTYSSIGAVADIFDISCLYDTPAFSNIDENAFAYWDGSSDVTTHEVVSSLGAVVFLGSHYFIPNPITREGISPIWDFSSSQGNTNAFVVAAKEAGIAAPTGSADVDWLQLKGVQGDLAAAVYRVDTRGGQPPTSCSPGSPDISVKYTSNYYFYGATFQR